MNMSLKKACIVIDLVMACVFFLMGILFYNTETSKVM